jgi:F0F1-type ATP synthase assembly protein I
MAFHRPIPDDDTSKQNGSRSDAGVKTLVQAERLMQIALVLPCALVIGWGMGWWVDAHFHTHWATIGGVILGMAAGMVSAVRMAMDAGKTKKGTSTEDGK